MDIVYKKLSENELNMIIKMRIDQLVEEYTSEAKTEPEDVDLEPALMDFIKGIWLPALMFRGLHLTGIK